MEKLAAELRESKMKQKSIGKAYQSVHALASSLIVSSVQWEDLEDHLESTRSSIEARFQELERREAEIGARSAQLDAKESDFNSKADELRGLEGLLEQKLKEVINCKNHLHSLQSLIREHSDEVLIQEKRLETVEGFVRGKERECEFVEKQIKERVRKLNCVEKSVEEKAKLAGQLSEIQKELELKEELARAAQRWLEECDKELIVKEERLGSIRKSLAECCNELESKERRVREIESKEKDFVLVKKSLEEWSCELELKEREMGVKETELESKEEKVREIQKSIGDGQMHLDAISKGLQKKESEIADQARELALNKKEFDVVIKSTEERYENLKSKERQLEDRAKEIELKQKEFATIKLERRILTVGQGKLESKQKEFDSVKKSTEELAHKLKVKEVQLEDRAKELEVKQKELDSVKKSAEEQIRSLKANERQLEVQAKDLELKQKELDSMKQSLEEQARNLKSKENTSILLSQVKVEPLEHFPSNHAVNPPASNQCSNNLDGRGLQLFMNKHLKGIDSASSEITARLQASADPAKLVLDAMQGFYPSDVTVDNMECDFDLGIIRRSCIVLLETLKRVSPQIIPQVKEEAVRLARDWKGKMTTERENWLEVLGFLRLVTIYDITSAFDAKELQSLIATVGENEQATELSQAVGCKEMESTSIVCYPVKTEEPESSPAKDAATASQNLQLTAPALQTSADPGKLLDVMQNSFAGYWKMEDVRLKESVMLFNINLLEQTAGVLSNFGVQVELDALKLAFQWKAKIKVTQNPLETLGFVQFTAKFGILTAFDTEDIVLFLGRISQHKQSRELCRTLALADKIPADFIDKFIQKKQWIEAVRVICTFKFSGSHPPVPKLQKFVKNLRKRSNKCAEKKSSLDEKDKVIDNEIATLRDVIQCINDCNLQSEYPSSNIEEHIAELEKKKRNWRRAATPLACKAEPEEKDSLASDVDHQEQKKTAASNVEQPEQIKPPTVVVQQQQQSRDIVPSVDQQELNKVKHGKKRRWNQVPVQHQNKFQRTSGAAAITYALPIHTRNLHERFTYPGKYGAAPNINGLGFNCGPAQQFTYLGMPAACNYGAGAIPNPGMYPPYPQYQPSLPGYGPYQV